MATTYYKIELEQDAYGSAVICLPDELCHDMALEPNEGIDSGGYDQIRHHKGR
jgi:hypothetical protein